MSLKEYTKCGILTSYRSLDTFLQAWNDAKKKQALITELENQGLSLSELQEETKSDLDIFDLICHVGGKQAYLNALRELEAEIYRAA